MWDSSRRQCLHARADVCTHPDAWGIVGRPNRSRRSADPRGVPQGRATSLRGRDRRDRMVTGERAYESPFQEGAVRARRVDLCKASLGAPPLGLDPTRRRLDERCAAVRSDRALEFPGSRIVWQLPMVLIRPTRRGCSSPCSLARQSTLYGDQLPHRRGDARGADYAQRIIHIDRRQPVVGSGREHQRVLPPRCGGGVDERRQAWPILTCQGLAYGAGSDDRRRRRHPGRRAPTSRLGRESRWPRRRLRRGFWAADIGWVDRWCGGLAGALFRAEDDA